MPIDIFFQLRASDISALAGRHYHRTAKEAIAELVNITCPRFDAKAEYLKCVTAKIEREVRLGGCYQQVVNSAELDDDACRRAEAESLTVFDRFSSQIPYVDRRRLRRSIKTVYLKDRGLFMEMYTLRRLYTVGIRWLPTEKSERFFSKTFTTADDVMTIRYKINGCIDGIEFDDVGNKIGLIEIKTRKDKVYFPQHDIDQVMMYLILSDLPQGRLVQDVNGKLNTDCVLNQDDACTRWNVVRLALETSLREAARQVILFARPRASIPIPIPHTTHTDDQDPSRCDEGSDLSQVLPSSW